MVYWRLHYHLVWTTWHRHSLIIEERARVIEQTVYGKARELGVTIHQVGGIEDHIHVVASIPPVLSVATCVKHLKGASSRAANVRASAGQVFRWQEGYGALSLGERSLTTAVAYVRHQPRHHRERTTLPLYETTDGEGNRQSSSDDCEQS